MRDDKVTFFEAIIFLGGLYWVFTTNSSYTFWTISISLLLMFLVKSYLIFSSNKKKKKFTVEYEQKVNDEDITINYNDYESQDVRKIREKLIDNKDSVVLWIATRHYSNSFFQTNNNIEGEILKDLEKTQSLINDGKVSRGKYPLLDSPDINKPIYFGSVYETNEYYEPYDLFLEYINDYIESVKSQDNFSDVDFFLQNFIMRYEESVDDEFNYDSYHETRYSSKDVEILNHNFGNGSFKVLNDITWYKDETWKYPEYESWEYKVLIK